MLAQVHTNLKHKRHSKECLQIFQTWAEKLACLTKNATLGLRGPGGKRQAKLLRRSRSDPTGRVNSSKHFLLARLVVGTVIAWVFHFKNRTALQINNNVQPCSYCFCSTVRLLYYSSFGIGIAPAGVNRVIKITKKKYFNFYRHGSL